MADTPEDQNSSISDAAPVETEQPTSKLDLNNPVHYAVRQRMIDLEAALLNKDPMMKHHLAEIHKAMIQHEEIVHLLSDEEIAEVMRAQQMQTNTTLVREVKPTSTRATNKAAKLGMSDL